MFWLVGGIKLTRKQRGLSALHQTKVMDWSAAPLFSHSLAQLQDGVVWRWCCTGKGLALNFLLSPPGNQEKEWQDGRQNTTSLCVSAVKNSPSCEDCRAKEEKKHRSEFFESESDNYLINSLLLFFDILLVVCLTISAVYLTT